MDELRVPKRKVPVELLLLGGATRRVMLFLAECASAHAGCERVSDLLERGGDFLPALDTERGALTCIRRSAVVLARLPAGTLADEEEGVQHTIPTEHEVQVTLVGGQRLRGLVTYVLPQESARITDFLNMAGPFFPLAEREGVALVNKHHVVEVELLNP